jgi:hypothetical protein
MTRELTSIEIWPYRLIDRSAAMLDPQTDTAAALSGRRRESRMCPTRYSAPVAALAIAESTVDDHAADDQAAEAHAAEDQAADDQAAEAHAAEAHAAFAWT